MGFQYGWGRLAMVLTITCASWPGALRPSANIDTGWVVGLHMAAGQQLAAGHDWVYSYGPLGFVSVPAWFGTATGAASIAVNVAVRGVLVLVLLELLRPRVGIWLAAGVTFVFMAFLQWEAAELALLALCAWAVHSVATRRAWSTAEVAAVGVLGGALATVKLNTAIAVGGVGILVALSTERRGRDVAVLGGVAAATFLAIWMALGQPVGNIAGYVRGVSGVVDGYTPAMALEASGTAWHYAAALAAVVSIAAAASRAAKPRWPLVALLLWIGFIQAKHGFVRHDAHALAFFSTVAVVAAALSRRRAALAAGLLGVAAVALVVPAPGAAYRPVTNARLAWTDVSSVVRDRDSRVELTRRGLAEAYGDAATLAAEANGLGLHVDPDDAAVVFAARQRWDPLPNFQAFVAYTPELDNQNARTISGGGPARVLVDLAPLPLDNRFRAFDAPATRLGLLCHYRPLASLGQWSLLGRSGDRCGEERRISSVKAGDGETIVVPTSDKPDRIVVGRIRGAGLSVGERLRSTLAKPARNPSIVVNGRRHRFVRALAGQPHMLRVPVAAPFGPGSDGVPVVGTLAVESLGDVEIEFSEIVYS